MLDIKIKSLWLGKAWFHEKYLKKAVEERINMRLLHVNGEVMVMDPLDNKITKHSETFTERFSKTKEKYHLYGVVRKGQLVQDTLFAV